MINDPISDMITRIRNGIMVKKKFVEFSFSKVKWEICRILKEESYISSFDKIDAKHNSSGNFDLIKVELKYSLDQDSLINNIKRVSKPGCRVYVDSANIPVVLDHSGIAIISTSKGIITNKEARKLKVGGEVLFEVF